MWGGGVDALSASAANLVRGRPPFDSILRFDPGFGWWMLSWGRNATLTTEAVYHVLMAAAWLMALDRRWGRCQLSIALLAATHPFTGVLVLAAFLAWSLIGQYGPSGDRPPPGFVAALLGMTSLFFAYYFLYLPHHPQHRALQVHWSLPWVESLRQTLTNYGPIVAIALVRLARDRFHCDRDTAFLATCAAIAFLLSHHHWLVSPRQPLHFTRGYVWMPLFLIGLPVLRDALVRLSVRPVGVLLTGMFAMLASADNIAWLVEVARSGPKDVSYLSPGTRDVFRWVNREGVQGVLLCEDATVSYLAATYTSCRPWLGHIHNTPDYQSRLRKVERWLRTGQDGAWVATIDTLITRAGHGLPPGAGRDWVRVHGNDDWSVYRRKVDLGAAPRPPLIAMPEF
jgi:hypothetical protein